MGYLTILVKPALLLCTSCTKTIFSINFSLAVMMHPEFALSNWVCSAFAGSVNGMLLHFHYWYLLGILQLLFFCFSLCFFFFFFLTVVIYGHLFCGILLSQKMSKELHDNKEMPTGTLLFSSSWICVSAPPPHPYPHPSPQKITKISWCREGYLVSSS